MGKEDRKQVYIALVMSCTRMDDSFQIRSESKEKCSKGGIACQG